MKIVEHGLAEVGVRGVAVIVAGVEALGMTSLGEQLQSLEAVMDGSRRLPVVLEAVRNDTSREFRVAKRQCLIDAHAIEGKARRQAYARIGPRRLRVPLVGKVEPECALDNGRFKGEPLRALELFGELTSD